MARVTARDAKLLGAMLAGLVLWLLVPWLVAGFCWYMREVRTLVMGR